MKFHVITAAICVAVVAATAQAQHAQQADPQQTINQTSAATTNTGQAASAAAAKPKALNNKVCPVSDEPIPAEGGKKVVHKGYEISLCCGGCVKKFNKNPDAYLDTVLKAGKAATSQSQGAADSVKPVNNTNCPVSGQPVGSMQKGSNVVYKGYQIGLCCDGCIGRFNQNADSYLQALLKPKS